jgi:hypothetical protein
MDEPLIEDYLLSFPERVLRSAAAVVGGTSVVLTETLLPDVVKQSTSYRILFGDLQRFVVTRVAQVEPPETIELDPMSDDYVYHKMAGSVLEMIGLLRYRFSPVWAFAIAGDVAGGGRVYFERLVENLKGHEVISQDSEPDSFPALLEAMQTASNTSAKAIDRPPLSQSELADVTAKLSNDYGRMLSRGQKVLPRLEDIQTRMDQVAIREDVSLEELSGIMTLQAAKLGKSGLNSAVAVGKTSGELFSERILDSYIQTLDEINQYGLPNYLGRTLEPFLRSAVRHFSPEQPTWTERKLGELRGASQTADE